MHELPSENKASLRLGSQYPSTIQADRFAGNLDEVLRQPNRQLSIKMAFVRITSFVVPFGSLPVPSAIRRY